MADEQLSQQDIQDLQEIASKLPAGHPTQQKISLLLSSQPTQFEQQNSLPQYGGGTTLRSLQGVGRGLGNLVGGMYQTIRHPADTLVNTLEGMGEHMQHGMYATSTTEKIAENAAAIPFLGPLGQQLGKRAAAGDVAGAVSEGLTTAAAPSVMKELGPVAAAVPELTDKPRTMAAEGIVSPLVRRSLGQTMEDLRFGRNPRAALTKEGLVGLTKTQLVEKAIQRGGELKRAANDILAKQGASKQLNVGPIIDGSIDAQIDVARQTGNDAAITRLDKLRVALQTQYGNTVGTPLEINNLKHAIGERAADLKAFRGVDPVEGTAATAMADVYRRINDAVNKAVPDAVPYNNRMADLLTARHAIERNIAGDIGKPLTWDRLANLPFRVAGSTPLRTIAGKSLVRQYAKP